MATIEHHGVPEGQVVVERFAEGQPHRGKVLAAVQAHADDIPFFCGGTVAKLIAEGYEAYLIQTTNDEKCGPTPSIGETVLSNERDVETLARVLGFKSVFNLGYRNHRLDGASPEELRARMIFLFRLLQVDTVFTFNPWGHGEENPDHTITGQAVEAACWMAAMDKDYPEHFAAGLKPKRVTQRYYWVAREGQPFNRVVDIGPWIEQKVAAISANKSQGPGGSQGSRLRAALAARGLRLPALDGSEEDADRAYIRLFQLDEYRALGEAYGLEYAEAFYYVGDRPSTRIEEYIRAHAVPLE
ncbi:MAG: PIG-L family deacetylase [Chloroflexi bacterium]|nr:PIG-L family deacetylase [Chloroflexota bacterium]